MTFDSESFSFLKCQDTRRIAATVVIEKVLFLGVSRFAVGRGLDKQDNVLKPAIGLDQIRLVRKSFTAIILVFGDLSWQKVRWTLNELHLTYDRARVDNIEGYKERVEQSS